MEVFVDTSALVGCLDARAPQHQVCRRVWQELRSGGISPITTNYVLIELLSVCQRRFGLPAAAEVAMNFTPLLSVIWVDEAMHAKGVSALLTANRRDLSLVDCVSFDVMRRLGIARAFTLDRHYADQGFACLPETAP